MCQLPGSSLRHCDLALAVDRELEHRKTVLGGREAGVTMMYLCEMLVLEVVETSGDVGNSEDRGGSMLC